MEYIILQVKIPNTINQTFKNEIYQLIITLPHEVNNEDINSENVKYTFTIPDIKLATYIEEKLDNYIKNKVQYNLIKYTQEAQYPSSIRINRKGAKIFTKKQTKFFSL